ncbi:PQQ-binding-like beta-propeller repeat protein [uncultured Treponema sp.]|uniref:outer membrane protein assembly factor BamB family protein n=1 Tax=uncultured Treponema sp. TaxID=162155 RepID=UPI0025FD4BB1|nr:PQQ-binding-like beta-propeller repeat protein [uncultured Treponema sp.]
MASNAKILTAQTPLRSIDLNAQEPSWYTVIGGNAVSPCIETSYGVALLSDGRLLSACTSAGNVIWQRSIKGRPSSFLTAFGDFLYVVTDSNRLNLVNPSGLTLWTETAPFPIADFPVVGRDGRVFVRGKKGLACYGLDGKRKWKTVTEELGDFPISLLNDGSFLVFLKKPKDNRTVANRYSPFGEKLEDITFTAIATSTESSEKGVLVSLKNGSIGLVSVTENGAESKWVNGSGNTNGAFKICYSAGSENSVFFFQNGSRTEAVVVKTDTGELLNRFQVGNIAPSDFKLARATQSGYFISGAYSACEFLEDGTIMYASTLPPQSKWTSLFYTNKNHLILCMKDWTIKAWLMNQTTKTKIISSKIKSISYITAKDSDPTASSLGIRALDNQKMAEISESFKKGDYGAKEKEYLTLIKTEAENYIKSYSTQISFQSQSQNYFAENAVYAQNLLYLMGKTGTREFSTLFARLLSSQIDSSQLLSVIAFAGNAAYDENGQVLAELEKLILNRIRPSESVLLKAVCDSTYEICRYMGRPALIKRGKNILSHLFYPQYDKTVRDYARTVLTKMIELEKK